MKSNSAVSVEKVSDLTPDRMNANKGNERGKALIEKSLRDYGAGRSILIDKHGAIIAGNKTAENAAAAGLVNVIIVKSDGTKLIAVQRTDLDLNDPKARSLAIADNRAGQLSLEWDLETLKELESQGVDLAPFWSAKELEALWPTTPLQGDEDETPAPVAVPTSKAGDVYHLGKHRLLCGDSTAAADVGRLLGNVKPHLMVTDPPYGVEYDPKWRTDSDLNKKHQKRAEGKVLNDNRADWRAAWALFPGEVAYVWHSARHSSVVAESLQAQGFLIRSQIIWAKTNLVIGRGNYHWQHEPCWYAVRKGGTGHWSGDRKQSTLWAIPNMHRTQGNVDDGKTNHGTQKPVACMERPLLNNSVAGDAVYDPFGGSGTTLIAAEKTGRRCFMMELDPCYVDMIVARWEQATGNKATLDEAKA